MKGYIWIQTNQKVFSYIHLKLKSLLFIKVFECNPCFNHKIPFFNNRMTLVHNYQIMHFLCFCDLSCEKRSRKQLCLILNVMGNVTKRCLGLFVSWSYRQECSLPAMGQIRAYELQAASLLQFLHISWTNLADSMLRIL